MVEIMSRCFSMNLFHMHLSAQSLKCRIDFLDRGGLRCRYEA